MDRRFDGRIIGSGMDGWNGCMEARPSIDTSFDTFHSHFSSRTKTKKRRSTAQPSRKVTRACARLQRPGKVEPSRPATSRARDGSSQQPTAPRCLFAADAVPSRPRILSLLVHYLQRPAKSTPRPQPQSLHGLVGRGSQWQSSQLWRAAAIVVGLFPTQDITLWGPTYKQAICATFLHDPSAWTL